MASNHTTNYQLCQWEATDKVLRTDFNEDNQKIDAALATIPKIAVGTYNGTGESGSDHPNTLTFDFPPKMVIILQDDPCGLAVGAILLRGQQYCGGVGMNPSSNNGLYLALSWEGNSVSWYNTRNDSTYQLNNVNFSYCYFAIG